MKLLVAALFTTLASARTLHTRNSTVGQQILDTALTASGVPYAWGGGDCAGPTGDQPPYDYGDVGYDCSGLVCWAVCQVTGRDLFTEGLRVTSSMYCADEATLGYKYVDSIEMFTSLICAHRKYPYEERQAGDAVFFGGECSCADSSSIHHVGLMMYALIADCRMAG